MKRQPIIRCSLKTRSGFTELPDTYLNFTTFWRNDNNGFISGQFSDGWRKGGTSDGFRVVNIKTDDQTIQPSGCWLNAALEDDGTGRCWVKNKTTGETTSLYRFGTKTVNGNVRFDASGFYPGIESVTFEILSDDGAREVTISTNDCFVNGVVSEDEVATASQVAESNIPF